MQELLPFSVAWAGDAIKCLANNLVRVALGTADPRQHFQLSHPSKQWGDQGLHRHQRAITRPGIAPRLEVMRRRNVGISTLGGLVNIIALPDHPAGSPSQLGPFNVSRRVVGGVATQYHEIVLIVETQLQVGDGAVPAWIGFQQ